MQRRDLEERFAKFANQCVRFTEGLAEDMQEEIDPFEEAETSARIIESVTRKWTVPIIYFLYRTGELSFSELGKLLMGISSRTLSLRLRSLEKKGWVQREVVDRRPPRVLYSLTERGTTVAKMAGPMYLYIRFTEEG